MKLTCAKIPGHPLPPWIWSLTVIYLVLFFEQYATTSPYKVLAEEVDIEVREEEAEDGDATGSSKQSRVGGEDEDTDEDDSGPDLIVETKTLFTERTPHLLRTLLTGLPSPTSRLWSWVTASINVLLALLVADLVYRGPYFHPSHDLSFARVGFVSDHTAKIVFREPDPVQLPVFVAYRDTEARPVGSWKTAEKVYNLEESTDYVHSAEFTNLRPSTQYQYSLSNNHTGYFTTAPSPGTYPPSGTFTFLTSSCLKPNFPYNPFRHPLRMPGLDQLTRLLPSLKTPQFMLFLGDFIYIDVPRRLGSTRENYRREYRQVYASPSWEGVATIPWLHVFDDHEIENDWDGNTSFPYASAADPYHNYHVAGNPPPTTPDATWFTFTSGPASFFLMDTRTYRSPENTLSPYSPDKTMLGLTQLGDLLTFIEKPLPLGVRWKFIVSSVPFTSNWRVGTADTWGGYLSERQQLLEAMWDARARGEGVIVLSGDRHEFAATSFPPPPTVGDVPRGLSTVTRWKESDEVIEFSCSPLSMFWLPVRSYYERHPQEFGEYGTVERQIKYIPKGNSKVGAIEIDDVPGGGQSLLTYRLFVDGKEVWRHVLTLEGRG